MGYGDRPAGRYLAAERRDYGAVGTKYIAEAGGNELGAAFYLTVDYGPGEALRIYLGDPLAGTHDVGRIYRLVG